MDISLWFLAPSAIKPTPFSFMASVGPDFNIVKRLINNGIRLKKTTRDSDDEWPTRTSESV